MRCSPAISVCSRTTRRPRPGSQCSVQAPAWVATTAIPQSRRRASPSAIAPATQSAGPQLPHQVVDEVLAEGAAAQGHDEERRPSDLEEQVPPDEQPRAPVERVGDRDRREQAREHEPDERQPHRQRVRLQPVRPRRRHVPGVDDHRRQDHRLGAGAQIDVREQVVRELPDREDVDEIEEELERRDHSLGAGRPRDGDPHRRDRTRVAAARSWSPRPMRRQRPPRPVTN